MSAFVGFTNLFEKHILTIVLALNVLIILIDLKKSKSLFLPKIMPVFAGFTNLFEKPIWTILLALIVMIILADIEKTKSIV